jgi:hypothetical protein
VQYSCCWVGHHLIRVGSSNKGVGLSIRAVGLGMRQTYNTYGTWALGLLVQASVFCHFFIFFGHDNIRVVIAY